MATSAPVDIVYGYDKSGRLDCLDFRSSTYDNDAVTYTFDKADNRLTHTNNVSSGFTLPPECANATVLATGGVGASGAAGSLVVNAGGSLQSAYHDDAVTYFGANYAYVYATSQTDIAWESWIVASDDPTKLTEHWNYPLSGWLTPYASTGNSQEIVKP